VFFKAFYSLSDIPANEQPANAWLKLTELIVEKE
jgi:hypothetical protein